MKSKKPFISREFIYNNIKRFWWITVLFTLALFLVSPLVTLTNGTETIPKSGYNIYFSEIFDGTIIFLFTVPIFIGVMVFRYMQNPKSMVTIHTMPYTRLRLYVNNIISGLILLIVPILLNTAFLSVIQLGNLGGTYFKEGIVLRYLSVSLLTSVSLYFWTVFVGMFTGSSIAQIIFTYILNFLFAGIVTVSQILLSGVLYGFTVNEEICKKFLHISPIAQVMFLNNYSSSEYGLSYFLVIDIIVCAVALVVGYFVYKYRNLETAGDVVSGKYVKPLFKYGVTICVMLVGAVYVAELFSLDSVNIFIYLLFALIGYVISEMLIRKSFKILDSYKGFLVFAVVFIIVSLGLKADLFGYEKYVPDIVGIKSAALNGNVNFAESTVENPQYGVLYDKENIKNIIKLHESIVEDKNINLTEKVYTDSINISYELLDGRVVKRVYEFETGKYTDLLNKVYDSKEYIMATNNIFDYSADDIYSIRIYNALLRDNGKYVGIADKVEIEKLFDAMQKDILNTTNEEKSEYNDIYRIELTLKNKDDKAPEPTQQGEVLIDKALFISETFNINAENVNNYIVSNGYKDKLLYNTDIESIKVNYDNGKEFENVITSVDKINEIMVGLYTLPSRPYNRYDDLIELELTMNDDDTVWITLSENDDEVVKLIKE